MRDAVPVTQKLSWQTWRSDAPRDASLQILFKRPTPAIVFATATNPHVLLALDKVQNPLRLLHKKTLEPKRTSRHNGARFSTAQLPKVLWDWCALRILTSKRASRHYGVHFFETSQLTKVLRTRSVLSIPISKCVSREFNSSTSKSAPKRRCFNHFYFFTSRCASRHNRVHFLISHPTR